MVQNARSFQAKCSTGVKMFEFESLIRKIQKSLILWDGKQLTESQDKRIQRISKVAHSSGRLVKCWFAPFGAVLLGGRFMETNANSIKNNTFQSDTLAGRRISLKQWRERENRQTWALPAYSIFRYVRPLWGIRTEGQSRRCTGMNDPHFPKILTILYLYGANPVYFHGSL